MTDVDVLMVTATAGGIEWIDTLRKIAWLFEAFAAAAGEARRQAGKEVSSV